MKICKTLVLSGLLLILPAFSWAQPNISVDEINDMINSIPSPLELSFLVKDLEIKYNKSILRETENVIQYNNDCQKALNFGVYYTNLGLATNYEQKQDALFYLGAVKRLAGELKAGQNFDLLEKLISRGSSVDSILLFTSKKLSAVHNAWKEKQRSALYILSLAGGWLESFYLTCEIARKRPKNILKECISEHYVRLEVLMLLFSFYEQENADIKTVSAEFASLVEAYEKIRKNAHKTQKKQQDEDDIKLTRADIETLRNAAHGVRQKIIERSW